MPAEPSSLRRDRPHPVQVAGAFQTVPSSPLVLNGLARLLRTGNTTLPEIGRLVRMDPGLSARVLRAAHLSAQEEEAPCFTIEDAINRMGSVFLHHLVVEVTRTQVFDWPLGVYGLDTAEFWRWSVATGIAAQVIAERSGDDADVAYAIGLMHRVGMLAVEEWARLESSFLVFAHRGWVREYSAAEAAVLGFTHAEVGAALLHAWNFPQSISEPIRCQYVPLRYGPHARMTCVLHAAKWLGATVCADECDAAPEFPADRYLDVLHLTSFDLAKLVVDVRIQLGAVRNHLAARAA